MGLQTTEHNCNDLAHTQALSLAPFLSKISPHSEGTFLSLSPFLVIFKGKQREFFIVKFLLSSTVGKIHEIKK